MPSDVGRRFASAPGAGFDDRLAKPILPDIGVIALVPEEWNLVWQPRHQVLFRLARYFHVVWVDPRRHWRRWVRRDNSGRVVPAPEPPDGADGFVIHKPWLPMVYRPPRLARFLLRIQLKAARAILVRHRCTAILLYLWRPQFVDALQLIPFTQSHYHIDDEYSFLDDETPMSEHERRLIGAVDQVFVTSRGLLAGKGGINPHTAFVPNGVDFRAYSAAASEPPDLASIPRPRIGYTGVVKPKLDWPLLDCLTAARPDWSFVFVGPVQREATTLAAVAELRRRSNVHFLGFKPLQALAAYPQSFDVCIMPYRINHYTNQIYPLKLHEYLASGQPTVGPPIATLTEFSNVVTVVQGTQAWLEAIETALEPAATAAEKRAKRQSVARHYDWELIVQTIARTITERLGPSWLSRFDQALERRRKVALLGA
jgi:glycosyltransferase involved in cell wall biosynthesis